MSKNAEVIIVGSGVIGCAAAYYLAKKELLSLSLTKMKASETEVPHEMAAESDSQEEIRESCPLPCMRWNICGRIYRKNLESI